MTAIKFTASPYILRNRLIMRLPEPVSKQLSSRSQVAVNLSINQQDFLVVLEPDGEFGHWLNITSKMQQAGVKPNEPIEIEMTQTKIWPEVVVPADLAKALATSPAKVQTKWADITAMARWEWVRWIGATNNPDTRSRRIEVSISKLNGKHRRPCCFNLAACTDMELSHNSRLASQ